MIHIESLKRLALGPIDLEVADGECVALTGASGSGKSLLLRAIADLDPNTAEVSTQSGDRSHTEAPDWRRKVAYLPAESGWWADKVNQHFIAPEKVDLTQFGLGDGAMDWEVARLSSGERQRLAFLRLLEHKPEVLLLDEPTAPLDAENTLIFETRVKQCLGEGVSVIIVTHDPAQAKRLANRHFVLENGQLTEAKP